ncbi:DEAD/DEAH box helicase [Anaerococcus sp.]|uniref:DEAD/DEAH box helicase n=1 Tax=Anaerococcus sp. TaxID=1872515 RepID=UPI002A764F85|nr:DEAD/DEAH box helicase [Anaerococcus sp.]MDY2928169.1 DEAD/DEAH box helicase [Anaerococcus sp.]
MTDPYLLLSRPMREFVYKNKWPSLTKIQKASIKEFYESEDNLILIAPTASGKTEAAFLPAIAKANDFDKGLRILYISPLIALINDQFKRVFDLCDEIGVSVTSWHGEANQTRKEKLLENPSGICLITPESLEAIFVNKSFEARNLFKGIDYIIVDEIHSFLTGNRGCQLRSLLKRILAYTDKNPRFIGLSATAGDLNYDICKGFFKNNRETKLIVDSSKNELEATISYNEENNISDKSIEQILSFASDGSMLAFPNSRKLVEELAVKLKRKVREEKLRTQIFSHHSSVSKNKRKEIEDFAKNSKGENFIICATSTLELGIDIGSVHSICQYGPTFSVLSLAQRLGRSGRKTGKSILHQIATNPWDLVQSLATIILFKEGRLDKINPIEKAYDVFAHQILSTLLENNGLSIEDYEILDKKLDFGIDHEEFIELTEHMVEKGYIERLENEYIGGLECEKLLKMGSFYNQFISKDNFHVFNEKGKIGEIEKSIDLKKGDGIYLGGLIWEVQSISLRAKKITVTKAEEGKAPDFGSSNQEDISDELRRKMEEIVGEREKYSFNEKINGVIDSLNISPDNEGFYLINDKDGQGLRTFRGTRLNRTISLMLNIRSSLSTYKLIDSSSTIRGKNIRKTLNEIKKNPVGVSEIQTYLESNPKLVGAYLLGNKYMDLVSEKLKIKYIMKNLLDLEGAYDYLKIEG